MSIRPGKIPSSPGVYIFLKGQTPLYIGKASNLKARLASYFGKRVELPIKTRKMLKEATRLEITKTASEIEALIKEAELIKRYRPKYNLLMRDDKSYFYVGITKGEFPRIFIGHQPGRRERPRPGETGARYFGPFTSGSALRAALKLLRRVFPYCTCTRPHMRPCLSSAIGRCVGFCCVIPRTITEQRAAKRHRGEYRKNIRRVIAVLSGERGRLIGHLKREMKDAVRRERYEEAARLRDAISGLKNVFAHRQVLHTPEARYPWPLLLGRLQSLLKTKRDISRIEGYDISNISGTNATGSMIVFANGMPDKSQYRKFRIRAPSPPGGASDTAMHREVLTRRLNHSEWDFPELIIIDGGKGQLNAALGVLRKRWPGSAARRPIVTALAKREEILFTEKGRAIPLRHEDAAILHFFQRVRDESHRFARAYHHKLRKKHFALANQHYEN